MAETERNENTVLAGANSYEEKYYLNPAFQNLPEAVKVEIRALAVLFTERIGGILTLEFTPEGALSLKTRVSDFDYYYDEIEAELEIRKVLEEHRELFESLELYYRLVVLGEGNVGK